MDKDKDILIDSMDERIESFLRGTMSAKEEGEFKQEIKSNPELRSRAMEMTALVKGLHTHESNRENMLINSITANQSVVANKGTRRYSFLWWACSAAAVCVIFFNIFKAQRYRTLDDTISPYYTNIPDSPRGDTDSVTVAHLYSLFGQIQKQRNVTNVIKELETIYASRELVQTYHSYSNDIALYLALAYVKDDQIDKAIPILEKLKEDNPDTPIYLKADELLKKLQDL